MDEHRTRLELDGDTILEGVIEPELLDGLADELDRLERDLGIVPAGNCFEGAATVGIYNLLVHGPLFERIPVHPAVLPVGESVLDRGCLVSSLSSIAICPGEAAQAIHADDQLIPIDKPHVATVCNTMWALTDFANRLVYGERAAPDEALRTFGSRLSRAIPMDELLLQLVESLRKTMSLDGAEVWTGDSRRLDRVVSVPYRPPATFTPGDSERPVLACAGVVGNAWLNVWAPSLLDGREGVQVRVAPACHSGEVLGLIVAERPADGDTFTEEEERVLTELARQVGLALHNVQLDSALQASLDEVRRQAEELRASRARIVATADAERRRIERNLHDGAQQHLVALAVNLRLTRDLVADDPSAAAEMLEALAASVKDTIQELRDLAHGIYPPLLMDSGLGEALRAAGSRSPLDVSVEADGVGRHPTEVEAAVYFCVLEALQNASKHAPQSHVDVRIVEEDGGLRFEVVDDGPGFDPAGVALGHGFVNMGDRLGAIWVWLPERECLPMHSRWSGI